MSYSTPILSSSTHSTPYSIGTIQSPTVSKTATMNGSYFRPKLSELSNSALLTIGALTSLILFGAFYLKSTTTIAYTKRGSIIKIPPFKAKLTPEATQLLREYYKKIHKKDINDQEGFELIKKSYYAALRDGYAYKCVLECRYASARITLHPYYSQLTQISNKNVKILDVGCCFGTDLRRLILDGFNNVFGVDVEEAFLDIGTDVLFKDRELFRDRVCKTDVLRADFKVKAPENFRSFIGHEGVDYVYCGSLYHLLNSSESIALTRAFAQLLKRGSGILFGRTVGIAGSDYVDVQRSQLRRLHSVESLTDLLKHHGFVDIEITTSEIDMPSQERITPNVQKYLDESNVEQKTLMISFRGRLGEIMSPKKMAAINPRSPSARPVITF